MGIKISMILASIMTVVPIASCLIVADHLPDLIPMQWHNGTAIAWMSKHSYDYYLIGIITLISGSLLVAGMYGSKKNKDIQYFALALLIALNVVNAAFLYILYSNCH